MRPTPIKTKLSRPAEFETNSDQERITEPAEAVSSKGRLQQRPHSSFTMPKKQPDDVSVKFTEALLNKNKPPVWLTLYLM